MFLMKKLRNNNFYFLEIIVLVLLYLVFLYIPYNWSYSKKVLHICGLVSLLCYLFSVQKRQLHNVDKLLILAIFIYGASFFIWGGIFGRFGGFYADHIDKARVIVALSFILLFVVNNQRKIPYTRLILFCGSSIFLCIIFLFAVYQKMFYPEINDSRVTFYLGLGATETAYIVSIFCLVAVNSAPKKFGLVGTMILFILSYITILLTVTRSAVLFFPLLFLINLLMFTPNNKLVLKRFVLVFLCIAVLGGVFNKDKIMSRIDNTIDNINYFSSGVSSNTSEGLRLTMAIVGVNAGIDAPLGQSIESRKQIAMAMAQAAPFYEPVVDYLEQSHLHNEILENFSLRGVWGLAILLFLYYAIFKAAFFYQNKLLFSIGTTSVVYGLTDVVLNGHLVMIFFPAIIFAYVLNMARVDDK